MGSKPPPYNPYYNQGVPPPPYQPPLASTHIPPTASLLPGGSTTVITHSPSYGTCPVIVQPVTSSADVIVVGGCPACRIGVLNDEFTLAGLCCAFWFFPIGILCCLAMKERRCTNCGAVFS